MLGITNFQAADGEQLQREQLPHPLSHSDMPLLLLSRLLRQREFSSQLLWNQCMTNCDTALTPLLLSPTTCPPFVMCEII